MDAVISSYLLKLRRANPFLATISLMANYRFDEVVNLFATDARLISINPQYFATLNSDEKTGLLLHLTLHAALLHPIRLGSRNAETWNIAADIVVNNIIEEAGQFIPPPKTAVEPKYKDFSVEQVYEELMSLHKKHPSLKQAALNMPDSPDCLPIDSSDSQHNHNKNSQPNAFQLQQVLNNLYPHHADLKRLGESSKKQLAMNKSNSGRTNLTQKKHRDSVVKQQKEKVTQHWRGALRKAEVAVRMSGKGRGEVPAGLLLEIDKMMNPEIDWRWLLWQFVVRTPDDFEGFDRRFIHQKVYLDQLESNRLNVVVAVDTSGSIDRSDLTQFMSELLDITQSYDFIQIKLYYVDSDIYGPYDLIDGFDEAPPQGGGGTDFVVFFKEVLENNPSSETDLIVYFTDGDGFFPYNIPEVETLWVVTAGGIPDDEFPFGQVARLSNQA